MASNLKAVSYLQNCLLHNCGFPQNEKGFESANKTRWGEQKFIYLLEECTDLLKLTNYIATEPFIVRLSTMLGNKSFSSLLTLNDITAGRVSRGVWFESEIHSVMFDSLWPLGLYTLWNSIGQNMGIGSHSLLQEIFPTEGSNPGLQHCRLTFY